MGYESRLWIGERSSIKELREGDADFFVKIAMFDLAKMGYGGEWSKMLAAHKPLGPTVYLYREDEMVFKDNYGDYFTVIPLEVVIETLEQYEDEGYRRIPPILALLRSLRSIQDQYRNLLVVHEGY